MNFNIKQFIKSFNNTPTQNGKINLHILRHSSQIAPCSNFKTQKLAPVSIRDLV